jgi:hypothetical protein
MEMNGQIHAGPPQPVWKGSASAMNWSPVVQSSSHHFTDYPDNNIMSKVQITKILIMSHIYFPVTLSSLNAINVVNSSFSNTLKTAEFWRAPIKTVIFIWF